MNIHLGVRQCDQICHNFALWLFLKSLAIVLRVYFVLGKIVKLLCATVYTTRQIFNDVNGQILNK